MTPPTKCPAGCAKEPVLYDYGFAGMCLDHGPVPDAHEGFTQPKQLEVTHAR